MKFKFPWVSLRAYKKLELDFKQIYEHLTQEIIKLTRDNQELKSRERMILKENRNLQIELELKSRQANENAYLLRHDPLTGLGNKLFLKESITQLQDYWKKVKKDAVSKGRDIPNEYICIAVIDLDDLKFINDNYGHTAGDMIIEKFSQYLSMCIRRSDVAIRPYQGGDEFIVLMPHTSRESAVKANRRFGKQFSSFEVDITIEEKAVSFKVKSSVGFNIIPLNDNLGDIDEIIKSADKKMYKKKRQRKSV